MSELLDPFEEYRNVTVEGVLGPIVFGSVPMPAEVAQEIWGRGGGIPLDIVPNGFWSSPDSEYPRFSEESLGPEF